MESVKDKIKTLAEKHRFELNDESDDSLLFTTRENGNVAEEIPSPIDGRRATALRLEILDVVPGATVRLGVTDEWVDVEVCL